MSGKTRPSQRAKVLRNVDHSDLSLTDKAFIHAMFGLVKNQEAEIERLEDKVKSVYEELQRVALMTVPVDKYP